ncbi:MAG: PHP domain-containing protein, partial [Alphaproteobacteria bacterium]|nr:PHP domain-containing protein [Alphaproteobacteria bacterium]
MTAYAELQVTSNFSFLRGGSHPDELMIAAAALGLEAVAIADRNTLAGVVRAHAAAKEAGIRLLVGARLDLVALEGAALAAGPEQHVFSRPLSAAAPSAEPAHLRLVDDDEAQGSAAEPDEDTPVLSLLCFPTDRAAYGRLSRLITTGRRRAP